MLLSARLIVNYANVNQFSYEDQWKIRAGDPNTLYFQLIDLDQEMLRYMAGIGDSNQPYSVLVSIPSIDNSKTVQLPAIQSDPNDASVWQIMINSSQIPNSGNVIFTVYQGTTTRSFKLTNALHVDFPGKDGSC